MNTAREKEVYAHACDLACAMHGLVRGRYTGAMQMLMSDVHTTRAQLDFDSSELGYTLDAPELCAPFSLLWKAVYRTEKSPTCVMCRACGTTDSSFFSSGWKPTPERFNDAARGHLVRYPSCKVATMAALYALAGWRVVSRSQALVAVWEGVYGGISLIRSRRHAPIMVQGARPVHAIERSLWAELEDAGATRRTSWKALELSSRRFDAARLAWRADGPPLALGHLAGEFVEKRHALHPMEIDSEPWPLVNGRRVLPRDTSVALLVTRPRDRTPKPPALLDTKERRAKWFRAHLAAIGTVDKARPTR